MASRRMKLKSKIALILHEPFRNLCHLQCFTSRSHSHASLNTTFVFSDLGLRDATAKRTPTMLYNLWGLQGRRIRDPFLEDGAFDYLIIMIIFNEINEQKKKISFERQFDPWPLLSADIFTSSSHLIRKVSKLRILPLILCLNMLHSRSIQNLKCTHNLQKWEFFKNNILFAPQTNVIGVKLFTLVFK